MLRALAVERAGAWPEAAARGTVTLSYEARHRRRFMLRSDGGEAFLLDLARATVLEAGDGLALSDGGWFRVEAAPEPVVEIRGAPGLLLRIAWHLGNRHLPTGIAAERLVIRDDPVIVALLERLGAAIERRQAPFTPEGGAYGTPGHHHQDHHHDRGEHHHS